jgi:toxin YoeB
MTISFHQKALKQYAEWAATNMKVFQKINRLINENSNTPYKGTGKPEPLKHNLSGYWSREITPKDRLVDKVVNNSVTIIRVCP